MLPLCLAEPFGVDSLPPSFKKKADMPKGVYQRTEKHIEVLRLRQKKMSETNIGRKRPDNILRNWKGGKRFDKTGYVLIYQPNHPNKQDGNYVQEHRLVIEQFLGRYLRKEETIHHLNKIKTDNRLENLKLFPNIREHMIWECKQKKETKLLKQQFGVEVLSSPSPLSEKECL